MFRSEPMSHVRLVMLEEAAAQTVGSLGKDFGHLHVIDKGQIEGPHYKKHKVRTVAIAAWEKKLKAFRGIMIQEKVAVPGPEVEMDPSFKPDGDLLEALPTFLDPIEEDMQIHVNFKRQQTQMINEQIERIEVLKMCRELKARDEGYAPEDLSNRSYTSTSYGALEEVDMSEPLLSADSDEYFSETLSGAISTTKQILFERMLFRVSRGNAIVNFREVEQLVNDPQTGEPVQKTVFSIIAIRAAQMQRRIKKICAFFGANLYSTPRSIADFERELSVSHKKLGEHRSVLVKTEERINDVLSKLAFGPNGGSPLVNWTTALQQELAVCETMKRTFLLNQGGATGQQQTVVVLLGWVPTMNLKDLYRNVEGVNKEMGSQQVVVSEQESTRSPPTYFRTNEFTGPFQSIVDTYGIARYREVNPGLFTIVTFPFLYGVMYGDMLHGSLLLIFSLYLIYNADKFKLQKKMGTAGMLGDIFEARYMIMMMSAFAVYTGVIYNDCASIPIDLFGSRWDMDSAGHAVPKADVSWPYPFGIDPEWMGKKNELVLLNSLKMKMAVILGVIHMSFGICLGLANHLHFKNYLAVVFEFIPRLVFLLATFGYMCFLVIFKWSTDWVTRTDIAAPNLIQTMIGMFLRPGSVDPSVQLYPHQATIQLGLLLAALICVPLMLFGEPCITNIMFKRKYGKKPQASEEEHLLVAEVRADGTVMEHSADGGHDDEEEGGGHGHGELGPNYDFGDHLINQAIHTIEFVLGAVSNTASYLRLWALSLAHAQLAKVFWDKLMMQYGIDTGSVLLTFVGFAGWAACTFAVLLCMDVVECFLHALRLHWVEFQNKFYYADGYKFEPFNFEALNTEE